MEIKVFGPGCAKCQEAEHIVKKVVNESGNNATVTKVSDLKEMMGLGIMSTPTIAIDGKVVLTGRVPTKDDVKAWLGGTQNAEINPSASSCSCGRKC